MNGRASPRASSAGIFGHSFASMPSSCHSSACSGLPPQAASSAAASFTPRAESHAAATSCGGRTSRSAWQRLRIVGSSESGAALLSTKRAFPGGSSSVFSSVFAAMAFMRSAGCRTSTLPRPRADVVCAKLTAARTASTLISLLGFALLLFLRTALLALAALAQPSDSRRSSGISTSRSGCERASIRWQLRQTPQPAPCERRSAVPSHNQAFASVRPSSNCPIPSGPCSSSACAPWRSARSSGSSSQGNGNDAPVSTIRVPPRRR